MFAGIHIKFQDLGNNPLDRSERVGMRRTRAREKREAECFGLPRGGAIFGLLIGAMIILVGLRELFGWHIDFGPFAIIVVGLLFVVGAIYGLTRRS